MGALSLAAHFGGLDRVRFRVDLQVRLVSCLQKTSRGLFRTCRPRCTLSSYEQGTVGMISNSATVHSTKRESALVVIFDTNGRLLLQLRDDLPEVLFGGMISLFGGYREGAESFLECAVRELKEELSCAIPKERFQHVTTFIGTYAELPGITLQAEIFVVRDIPIHELVVTEGSLAICDVDAINQVEPKLTPIARTGIKAVLAQTT
jgi:8-oxo-dGTP diphosphatase